MNMEEYKRRIDVYLEGIYNLSPAAKKPYFSKAPCEYCKSELAGERYEFTGQVSIGMLENDVKKEIVELTCCVDCFEYLFS